MKIAEVVLVALATGVAFYFVALDRRTEHARGFVAFLLTIASVVLLIPRPDLWPISAVGFVLAAFLASSPRTSGGSLARRRGH